MATKNLFLVSLNFYISAKFGDCYGCCNGGVQGFGAAVASGAGGDVYFVGYDVFDFWGNAVGFVADYDGDRGVFAGIEILRVYVVAF